MERRHDLAVRVAASADLSPSCYRLELATREPFEAQPGQFGMLSCSDGLDPLLRRPFSIGGVKRERGETKIELWIKDVGRGTGLLRRMPPGRELRLLAPLGNTFPLHAAAGERLALVAGGIGLPPVLFAAENLAATGTLFDLYLGAASRAELLEVARCRAAAQAAGGELILTTDDGSAGEAGKVVAALDRRLGGGRAYARTLACGPNPMLGALAALGRERSLPVMLSLEEPMACGVGVCLGCVVELADGTRAPSCKEGPVFAAERLAERWWQ
jgi:dihydroorotate dehydrogenase electron transfer subunit